MKLQSKYADLVLNLLVAVAISLVVNFSYVLLMLVDLNSDSQPRPSDQRAVERPDEGVLSVHPDGYGYLVYENGDSVYVPTRRMRWLEIAPGDRIVADLMPPRSEKAHPMLAEIRTRNGAEFDYSKLYNGPSKMTELLLQLFYYLVVSFVMLSILTSVRRNYSMSRFVRRCLWCCVAAAALYCVAPVTEWHTGRIGLNFMSGRMFDYMLLLKCSFAVVASMLYGRIYVLISQRQAVVVENERLKNENLTTRYNMLVGQINPHFFFNSLNSLAMLVREKHDQKALTYIDQLSYTFRYIIQNGQSMLMTLDEELKFLEAYSYLFKIRYADKLFFDIDVDEKYLGWKLPAFSLQPLIDNAVKHNSITRTKPFHISVRTEEGLLVVSNPKVPKLEPEPSTGIGLENLRNRWNLITGSDIEIVDDGATFSVRSSVNAEKKELLEQLRALAGMLDGTYSQDGEYPAWEYRKDSPLRDLMCTVYREQFGKEPEIQAIHAGLECGLLSDKLPGLDCVSFGPEMADIHTSREKLNIASTARMWRYLLEILKRL